MTVEKLTDEMRYTLSTHPACRLSGPAALRIIDALTAELERLRAECEEWNDELDARVEARLADATAENERLRAEVNRVDSDLEEMKAERDQAWDRRDEEIGERKAAESSTATATALLTEWLASRYVSKGNRAERVKRTRAFLANQPAAPARTEAECPVHGEECLGLGDDCRLPARTEAEQAVLDACADLTVSYVMGPPTVHNDGLDAVIEAELARRGLK